jgi:GT2 family glycosyltransferase
VPIDLSIVIPSCNRPELLRACLDSVTRHAPAGIELVVVDDASSDGVISRAAAAYPGVRVLRRARRGGFCAAANTGIAAARGRVIEMLNDDTEVTAGWATAALAHFADPCVGAVAPLVLRWPGARSGRPPIVDSAGDRYYQGGVASKRGHGARLQPGHLCTGPVFGASASSAFYRRTALDRAGTFPDSFGAYFEDVDLSFRLHRAGYRVIYEPAAQVLHHVSASYCRPRRRLLEQQSRNEERVFWRNLPSNAFSRALPRHVAVLSAKAWRRWQEGTLTPFLFGRVRLLAELPELLRHRQRLAEIGPALELGAWEVDEEYWT